MQASHMLTVVWCTSKEEQRDAQGLAMDGNHDLSLSARVLVAIIAAQRVPTDVLDG